MAGGGEVFANESPALAAERAMSVPPIGRSMDAKYDLTQTSIPAVMIDMDSASDLRSAMENHPVFVFLSDSIVPESVDLLHVDMNMAEK